MGWKMKLAMALVAVMLTPAEDMCAEGEIKGPSANEVTPKELEDFNCTYSTGSMVFPLEGLETLFGAKFEPETIRGKYAIVNLWATWCPYCGREKPSIQQLYERYSSDSFAVLTISVGEEVSTVREYMEKNKYTFPVIVNRDNGLRNVYAPRIPVTYIIDPAGVIIAVIRQNKDWTSEQAKRVLGHLVPVIR